MVYKKEQDEIIDKIMTALELDKDNGIVLHLFSLIRYSIYFLIKKIVIFF